MTGVMYFVAMRTASIVMWKQSPGERGASTHSGASPLRPQTAWNRSDCSVLVGRPVEGPARCTSKMMSGSSVMIARPRASPLSAMPGPEVEVAPIAPAYDAPIAEQIAAISSSAWNVVMPKFLSGASECSTDDAGVIGYDPNTTGVLARRDAAAKPHASASLPVMLR